MIIWRGSRNGRLAARGRKAPDGSVEHPFANAAKAAPGLRSSGLRLGLRQCGIWQDACAGPARRAPAAAGRAARENPLPHLYQGRGCEYGDAGFRHAGAVDAARRRGAARRRSSRSASRTLPRATKSRRASSSRARSRRRAASRSRPSTPSAKSCCMSFRSRPMRRRALKSPTRWRRPNFWSARAAMFSIDGARGSEPRRHAGSRDGGLFRRRSLKRLIKEAMGQRALSRGCAGRATMP